MTTVHNLTRREFLRLSALGLCSMSALGVLASCTPATAPTPASTAAAVQATGAPTAAPQATAAPVAGKVGSGLIGKLEGPEVVTDTTKYPKQFKEAPALADLVKAGKLPAVKERIGDDPLVVKPLEIGKYGGTWRRGFSGPADQWNGVRVAGHDSFAYFDYTGQKVFPLVAKGWDLAADGKSLTVYLRKGMKWSDGKPFTADDIVFFYNDVAANKELTPSPSVELYPGGKPVTVEKVDANTIRYIFPVAYPFFLRLLASSQPGTGGQARRGLEAMGGYMPAEYMKQFHPKYVSKEELDKKIADAKFKNWVALFKFKGDWSLNPELPVISPWKTTSPINTPTWALERNPYCFWVDTEGNQLPYIDKISMTLGENLEVINLKAIAGEFDLQERHIDLGKLPVLLENQSKGNYKISLDPGDYGADAALHFNMAYNKDAEINKWFNTTDFRRALSLGVDRNELNEVFWLGTGVPGSVVPAEETMYNPGKEYRNLWHTYDTKKANEMLDKLGLTKKDSDGYRLRTDGTGRLRIEVMTYGGQFLQFTQIAEMIRKQWKDIGIELYVGEVERSLGMNRIAGDEHQLFMWTNDDSTPELLFSGKVIPTQPGSWAFHGNAYAKWFASGGTQGTKPTSERLLKALDNFSKAYTAADDERIRLCKEIYAIAVDEVFSIGTVGWSPASSGVRVSKTNLANVPGRMINNTNQRYPGLALPETFFFKS